MLSHHNFNRSVALDWTKGANCSMKRPPTGRKRKENVGVETGSASPPKRPHTAFVNDSAVKFSGTLSCRLDTTFVTLDSSKSR